MSPLDATWHLLNALAAPFGVALITVLSVKLLWWTASAHRSFGGLWAAAYTAALTAHLSVWAWVGGEGSMLGYGLMVLATAAVLWWRVFLSARP